jgi:hypothetical protein
MPQNPLKHVTHRRFLAAATLNVKGYLIADVQVDLEVQQVAHALVVEGMQPLQHHDLRARTGSRAKSGTTSQFSIAGGV